MPCRPVPLSGVPLASPALCFTPPCRCPKFLRRCLRRGWCRCKRRWGKCGGGERQAGPPAWPALERERGPPRMLRAGVEAGHPAVGLSGPPAGLLILGSRRPLPCLAHAILCPFCARAVLCPFGADDVLCPFCTARAHSGGFSRGMSHVSCHHAVLSQSPHPRNAVAPCSCIRAAHHLHITAPPASALQGCSTQAACRSCACPRHLPTPLAPRCACWGAAGHAQRAGQRPRNAPVRRPPAVTAPWLPQTGRWPSSTCGTTARARTRASSRRHTSRTLTQRTTMTPRGAMRSRWARPAWRKRGSGGVGGCVVVVVVGGPGGRGPPAAVAAALAAVDPAGGAARACAG